MVSCPAIGRPPRELAKARAHASALITKIRAAHDCGDSKQADALTRMYLQSADAHLVAVWEAYWKLKPHRRPHVGLLLDYAQLLNPWKGTDEEVLLWLRPKDSNPNEYRPILDFGIENKALQHLTRHVLEARADTHPNQYGRIGNLAALRRVADLLQQGYGWTIETDIRNCYPSFDGQAVTDRLPLPKRVTHNTILAASLNTIYTHIPQFGPAGVGEDDKVKLAGLFADARQGVPQGSAASPLAVEMLLAPLFETLPPCGVATGYADNTLLMAKDENGVESILKSFWSALLAHPVGQLRPKPPRRFEPGTPIEFLGHQIDYRDGKIHFSPTRKNRKRFEAKVTHELHQIERLGSKHPEVASRRWHLRRYIRSWCASFALCDGIEKYRQKMLRCVP